MNQVPNVFENSAPTSTVAKSFPNSTIYQKIQLALKRYRLTSDALSHEIGNPAPSVRRELARLRREGIVARDGYGRYYLTLHS